MASWTEHGLLNAICEEPDNDWIRLVYADWLEEQGQPERAEFVRVQIELAGLPRPYDRATFNRWDELHRRQLELLATHGRSWSGGLEIEAGSPAVGCVTFRRGLLEVGDFHFTHLSMAPILIHPMLRYLSLSGINGGTLNLLLREPWLWELRGLTLNAGSGYGERHLPDWGNLAECRHFTSLLESLCLWGNGELGEAGAARVSEQPAFAQVRKLELLVTNREQVVPPLLGGPAFQSLDTLHLKSWHSDSPFPAIFANPRLARLERLRLSGYAVDHADMAAITRSAFWSGLRELTLTEGSLSAHAVEVLGLASGSQLESLGVVSNLDSESMATRLFGPVMKTIRTLDLRHPLLEGGVIRRLSHCEQATALRALTVKGCRQIGDSEAEVVAQSPILGGLYRLDLRNTAVESAGGMALARSPYLDNLADLNLSGCPLDGAAKAALRERFGWHVYFDE